MKKFCILIIFLLIFFPLPTNVFSYSALVPVKNKNGMYQATFKLERGGEVNINLPSDMALDENVSGSVVYSGSLRQFELLIEGKLILMHGGGNFTYKLPGNVSTGVVNVVLRYSNGIEIGKAFFPVSIGKLRSLKNSTDKDAFDLPIFGNSGQPLMVKGTFDGNYTNTLITLSEKRLRILAESTTSCVFVTNNSISGQGILKLSELGENQETKFTNLTVVKVKDREPQPVRDFSNAQDEFAKKKVIEKDYEKISDLSKVPPEELHPEDKEIVVKTPPDENGVNFNEKTVLDNKNVTAVNPFKRVARKTDNEPLDYSVIESELNRQFQSDFYPNNPLTFPTIQENSLITENTNSDLSETDENITSKPDSEPVDDNQKLLVAKSKKPSRVKPLEKISESEMKNSNPAVLQEEKTFSENSKKTSAGENQTVKSKDEVTEPIPDKQKVVKKSTEMKIENTASGVAENKINTDIEETQAKNEIKELNEKKSSLEKKSKTSETSPEKKEKVADTKIKKVEKDISTKKKTGEKTPKINKSQDINQLEEEKSAEEYDVLKVINPELIPGNNEIAGIIDTSPEKDKVEQPNDIDSEQSNKTDKIKEYCIQLASFKTQSEVDEFVKIVKSHGYSNDVKRVNIDGKGTWHRVRICDFNSRNEAESYKKKINQKKLNVSSIYITEY